MDRPSACINSWLPAAPENNASRLSPFHDAPTLMPYVIGGASGAQIPVIQHAESGRNAVDRVPGRKGVEVRLRSEDVRRDQPEARARGCGGAAQAFLIVRKVLRLVQRHDPVRGVPEIPPHVVLEVVPALAGSAQVPQLDLEAVRVDFLVVLVWEGGPESAGNRLLAISEDIVRPAIEQTEGQADPVPEPRVETKVV